MQQLSDAVLQAALEHATQPLTVESGGMHTTPALRLLLLSLALLSEARTILETGYDGGYTTRILAATGAHVVGVDNGSEYPGVKQDAADMLACYPNVELVWMDALAYLLQAPADSFDLVFIDDAHQLQHVSEEAK